MRKDYISADASGEHETAFVEKYWTQVWVQEGGPQGRIDSVPSRQEYLAMRDYVARLPKGARILDGGCGLGDWTMYFAREGFSIAGLDLSRDTVAQLRERFPQTEFVSGDIRHMDFRDGEFDAYFSWGVFEHFEAGLQPCITEAFRVLKPGGYLFVTVPFDNLRHSLGGWMRRIEHAPFRARFYQWRLTRAEIARELAIAGFEVIETRPIHKRSGMLRTVHHTLGLPYESIVTRGLAGGLAAILPGSWIAHMVFAAARKPDPSARA